MEQDRHSKRLTILALGGSILAKLSSGAELKAETGMWSELQKEERECRHSPLGEVENEEHFILRYESDA